MSDPKRIEKLLRASLAVWSKLILILDNRWQIESEFIHDEEDWPEDHEGDCAYITVYRGYCSASIAFNCARIEEGEIEHVVAHELAHILTKNLESAVDSLLGDDQTTLARSICEETVDQIARALVAARLYGERSRKRAPKK